MKEANKGKNKKYIIGVVVLVVIFISVYSLTKPESAPKELEEFAKCLTEKGVKMYGAYWCGHCNAQKEMFSDSFQYIDYVECEEREEDCLQAGIRGYPTWVFPEQNRIEGEATLEYLSQLSGCQL